MKRQYDIAPLPTTYNGIEYRSQLEARWAVFFDTLKIRFAYERTHFTTSLGGYLPDFWLPTGWIVEVKPTAATIEETIKAREVSLQGYRIAIVSGLPSAFTGIVMYFDGQQVDARPSYWQEISRWWSTRPRQVLVNLLNLQELTGKRNFTKAFKTATEYKFNE